MSKVKGKIKPIKDRVIVHNMNFGEKRTSTGIFIPSDDGKESGVHPRWGQVYAKGPENKEEFQIDDWILVEHGRWTRGIEVEGDNGETTTIRMIDNSAILMWSNEQPESN